MNTTTTFKDRALRGVAILGLIAILLLGAWGIIQIAFVLFGFLGNTGNTTAPAAQTQKVEQLAVSVPAVINSGVPFTLSFTHQNASGNYAFAVSYSCATDLKIQAPLPTGAMQDVACNTPFNYTNAMSNMTLLATATGKTQVGTTFSVSAKNLATNATTVTGTATATVLPAASTAATTPAPAPVTTVAPTKKTPVSTYVAAKTRPSVYGLSDLAVSMGSITQSNGRYSAQFTIQNIGTNTVPAGWTFNAALPTSPSYTYASDGQRALYPGDKVVYTLGFTMPNTSYTSYPTSYGYQTSPYNYPANCGYSTNYTYNGQYNYPGTSYGCNANNNYGYNTVPNYGYQNYNSYGYTTSAITVTVDPQNWVVESSKANNSATANVY